MSNANSFVLRVRPRHAASLVLLSLSLVACGEAKSESDPETTPLTGSPSASQTTTTTNSSSTSSGTGSTTPTQASTSIGNPTVPGPTDTAAPTMPTQPKPSETVDPDPPIPTDDTTAPQPTTEPVESAGGMGGSGEQEETDDPAGSGGDQGTGGQGPAAGGEPNAGGAGGSDSDNEDTPEAFFQAQCAACHGPTGQGVDGLGPDIAHPVRDYSTWVVRNGREDGELYPTGMMVFEETVLSDEMLEGILDFLADQPQPTTAEGLYSDYCAACHGADANGGPTGRAIKNEVGEVSRLVRSGHDLGNFEVRREFMPKWSAEELTDAELQLISGYIESL